MITYRYLRPKFYSFDRHDVKTAAKGGVCFRLEGNDEGLLLTYSMCHPDDVFSKDVARQIADERARHNIGFDMDGSVNTTQLICEEVLRICDRFELAGVDFENVRKFYLEFELPVLKLRIKEIWANHWATDNLDMLDHDVIEALNLRKMYEATRR